jgi:micrococcal nuclease
MNILKKIILVTFIVIIAGIVSFAAVFSGTEFEVKPEITDEPKPKQIDPVSIPEESQVTSPIVEKPIPKYSPKQIQCIGEARCIDGFVTRVIDGDTIVVGDKSIRFALVNTPEWGDENYSRANAYTEAICPVGSKVLVDEDDGQTEGSHGRIVAKIYCNNLVLNEQVLEVGHAVILSEFCSKSEFASEPWAQKHGCNQYLNLVIP